MFFRFRNVSIGSVSNRYQTFHRARAAGAGGQAAVPVSPQGQPADVGEAFVSNPPHRGRGGRAHGGVWAGGLTGVRLVRDTSVDHSRARAAQACLCSQMAVQLISLVNCPTTLTRNPRACRKTIHAIPESQGCLVLLCLGGVRHCAGMTDGGKDSA